MSSTGGGIHAFIGGRNGLVAAVVAVAVAAVVVPTVGGGGGGGASVTAPPSDGTGDVPVPTVTGSNGFPDAATTGVPSGTTLTAYSGPSTITTADTVVDSKTMGCITIRAPRVIIKNSRIVCEDAIYVVDVDDDDGVSPLSLTLLDDEIACKAGGVGHAGQGTALGDAFITGLRLNIYGCENVADVNQAFDIQDSYIHDLFESSDAVAFPPDGTHTDGFQFGAGHFNGGGGSMITGVTNVTIKHNSILSMGTNGLGGSLQFTTSAIISGPSGDTNVIIDNNLLAGGAYTLYCEQGGHAYGGTSHVNGNHFSTQFGANVGSFGASTECDDEVSSGNVIHETGAPYTLEG